jgi:hypothetical protein
VKAAHRHELVGEQVAIIRTKSSWTSQSGVTFDSDAITIVDPEMTERVERLLGEPWRWRIPGNVYTLEWNPNRMNVRIDKEGVITEVFGG